MCIRDSSRRETRSFQRRAQKALSRPADAVARPGHCRFGQRPQRKRGGPGQFVGAGFIVDDAGRWRGPSDGFKKVQAERRVLALKDELAVVGACSKEVSLVSLSGAARELSRRRRRVWCGRGAASVLDRGFYLTVLGLVGGAPWASLYVSRLLVSLHAASNRKTRQAAQFAHSLGVAERTKLSQQLRGQLEVISASGRQHAPSLGRGWDKTAF